MREIVKLGFIIGAVAIVWIVVHVASDPTRPRTSNDVQIACIEAIRDNLRFNLQPSAFVVCNQFAVTSTKAAR